MTTDRTSSSYYDRDGLPIEPGEEYIDHAVLTVPNDDPVNHPSHYTSGKYEVIDIIEDQLGPDGIRGFCLGNAVKYICRAGKKDPAKTRQDLEKAIWYINHYLEVMPK